MRNLIKCERERYISCVWKSACARFTLVPSLVSICHRAFVGIISIYLETLLRDIQRKRTFFFLSLYYFFISFSVVMLFCIAEEWWLPANRFHFHWWRGIKCDDVYAVHLSSGMTIIVKYTWACFSFSKDLYHSKYQHNYRYLLDKRMVGNWV